MYSYFKHIFISLLFLACVNLTAQSEPLDVKTLQLRVDSFYELGDYKRCIELSLKILEFHQKSKNETEVVKQYNEVANMYWLISSYEKAAEYFFKALKIAENRKDAKPIGSIYGNLGGLYASMGNTDEAKKYYHKALLQLKEINNLQGLGVVYTGLATLCDGKKESAEKEKYYSEAEKIYTQLGDQNQLGILFNNKSLDAINSGNYTKAKAFAIKAKQLFKNTNDHLGVVTSFINLQSAHTNGYSNAKPIVLKKVMTEGIIYLDSALEVLNKAPSPEYYMNIFRNKARTYLYLGDIDKSEYFLDRYETLKDSIYNLSTQEQIERLNQQYESEKKLREIQTLKADNEILNARSEKRKVYIILSIGIGIVLLFFGILFMSIQRKQQQTELLKNKAEFELQALVAQMNPHFTFNALNSIQHYILEKSKQEAYNYLAKFSKLIRMVLNNSEAKTVTLQAELELLNLYIELEQLRFSHGFEYSLTVAEGVNVNDIEIPTMLIQPYVENAIWHGLMNLQGERRAMLKIDITMNSLLKIRIEDNGVGRKKAKAFRKDEKHQSKGIGLTQKRLQMINQSSKFKGSSVTMIDLPDDKGTIVEILLSIK